MNKKTQDRKTYIHIEKTNKGIHFGMVGNGKELLNLLIDAFSTTPEFKQICETALLITDSFEKMGIDPIVKSKELSKEEFEGN